MEINILFIPIIIFLILNIKNIDKIFGLLILTCSFTATSLINLGEISFNISFIVGIFFIVSFIYELLKNRQKFIFRKINKGLLLFIFLSGISILTSIYIQNEFLITQQNGKFTNYNGNMGIMIKQYIYLLFCFFIYIVTNMYFSSEYRQKIRNVSLNLKNAVILNFAVSLYQLLSYTINAPFDEIFRMNPSSNFQPYGKFLRISGPSIEPSMMALFLLFSFGFFFFKKKNDYIILFVIILNGILTTSSTFFIGFVIFMLVGLILKKKMDKIKILNLIIISCISLFLLIKIYPQIEKLFIGIFSKINGEGKSGVDRTFNMMYHLKLSLEYPLFGIGYGISRSKDLLSTWILNIGYIGMCTFIYSFIISYKNINKYSKSIFISLVVFYIMEFISVPEPYFIYSWIFWGILDSKNKRK